MPTTWTCDLSTTVPSRGFRLPRLLGSGCLNLCVSPRFLAASPLSVVTPMEFGAIGCGLVTSRKRIVRTRSAACECRTRVLPSPERACNGAAHGLGAAFRAGRQLSRRSDRRRGSRGLACRARIRAGGSSQPARLWFRAAPWRSVARCRPASGAPGQPCLGSALQRPDRATSPPAVLRGACGEAFHPDRLEDDRGDDRLETITI